MKASFLTESVLYGLARGVSFLSQRTPAAWNVRFGSWVGAGLCHLLPHRRTVALRNLKAAFGATLSPDEYRRILEQMFRNLGMTFMEVARLPRVDPDYVKRWITIPPESRRRVEEARSQGKGLIFLTAHFGNWELGSIVAALAGYPMLVLVREQGWPRLNALLTRYRESKGCRMVAKGFPIRQLIRGLKEGRVVGIMSDQDGGRKGLLAPFFGRLASTAPGAIALGLKTRAPILPMFLIRQRGAAHTVLVEDPIPIPRGLPLEEQIRAGIASYLEVLERTVRRHPSQWLWLHRRWKSSPQRHLLLLSDGKQGHLNQSKGLAQRIEKAWTAKTKGDKRLQGVESPLVRVETVQIRYRHPSLRGLLALVASGFPRRWVGSNFWLRLALSPESAQALETACADWSVSCGASVAPVNLLWSFSRRSKAIHIHRSRWPSWRRFDLSVVPRHDLPNVHPDRRLLLVDGALTPSGDSDGRQVDLWRSRLNIDGRRQIGLLLGGPTKGLSFDARTVEQVVGALLESSEEMDVQLLVTSSRRTPPEVEERLKQMLGDHPRCRLLCLVNGNDPGGLSETGEAVPCILGLSQVLIVSGDSISMVSEAVAAVKPVIGFLPVNGSSKTKYHRFLRQLEEQGKVRMATPEGVGEAVRELVSDTASRSREVSDTVFKTVSGTGLRPEPDTLPDPVMEFLTKWL